MLSKEAIEELKNDGLSFEEIKQISNTIESIENGTAEFYKEEEFWELVKADMNNIMINREKCIK
ncbi:MAG: hypothetical protein PHS49_00970 [Candidatus Gracilibacteria bacterium]|nr:hypothetical protein [Candidatus Gracilibacteria bacterium]